MSQQLANNPTGFSPSDLPFYTELDDQEFEQFCTGLLELHPSILCLRDGRAASRRIVKADRLLSGTTQAGADIRAVADQGEVWFLQCKHVKEFGPAHVTEAIELAEKGLPQADQFVLITTCGLSHEARKRIDERPKWLWWNASHLTTLVSNLEAREGGINLVHRFFGPETARKLFLGSDQPLLNWQEFFAGDLSSERTQFHHRIPFVSQGDTLSRLEHFADSGAGRALILTASGGQGKSRLLLELAKHLELQPHAPRVRFLNLSHHGLTGEQSDFLAREEQNLLLIVDDAHRLDAAMEDVARATANAKSVRLLVATRPQALEALRNQLYKCGYAEKLEEPLHLRRWRSEDIHKLAEEVLDHEHRSQAPRLAALADRCPLLVVLGGALINSGAWPEAMKGQEAFRERVFKSFKEDFLNRQPEARRERLNRVMSFLSFVSPTPKTEALLNNAAEILGCKPLEVGDDVETLQAAGLLVENREGIRLYPDLFADAVLLDACLDQKGRPSFLHRTILSRLRFADFPALMRNVAQADWETRPKTGETGSLFEPVWQEFARRFQEGVWVNKWATATEWLAAPHLEGGPKERRPDRAQLLSQWASFAVYLPEKTLELAKLALQSVAAPLAPADSTSESQAHIRASVCTSLPALLKPIVTWHPQHADQALDILWSLDTDEPKGDWQNDCNAIAAIADSGSFAFEKSLAASEAVMDWLEEKLRDAAAMLRLRRQPWILSAVLKPFFRREVEHTWSTGNAIHVQPMLLLAEKTRPLRRRALAIVDKFLNSPDVLLSNAVVPAIEQALRPIYGRFGSAPSRADNEAWRPDRLEAVRIIEKAAQAHRDAPVVLLQLRRILRERCGHDSDPAVSSECEGVLSRLPDTFDLQVMRVLTSWADDESKVEPGPNFDSELDAANRNWTKFCRSVARETIERFKTAHDLCEFLRRQIRELMAINSSVVGGALLDDVAEISPTWCAALLEELLRTADPTLDAFLWSLISRANNHAPEAYRTAIEWLPIRGRPEQLSTLVNYLGWKHRHGGGLVPFERQCVLLSLERTEEAVVCALASTAGHHFDNEPPWAIDILSQLEPGDERSGGSIVEALGHLAKKHATVLDPAKVARCLANVGAFCFAKTTSDQHNLGKVAEAFPKQVYEHIRSLHERAETDPASRRGRGFGETLSLGPIGDAVYVDHEIGVLWKTATSAKRASFSQVFRLALIRSLLWADPATAPERLRGLIAGCKNGDELRLATELAATQGSRFVFTFPDIVRSFLVRGGDFSVAVAVRETLRLSACGGGRSYSEHGLDPQYRYILEQGEALANRYRDDAVLHKFYRMVAESERHQAEWNKRAFQAEDDMD